MPLTLCNASPGASVWVVEMGMNQSGEIARLSELTKPTVALVVNVQPVHLEKLGSLEAIRREKVSIAQGLPKDGVLVLPGDVDAPEWNGKIIRFGEGVEVRELKHAPQGESWDVAAEVSGKQIEFGLTPGAPHRLQNALSALASDACRRSRCRCIGEGTRPCRHHDRTRRRANRLRRYRDRRQF